MEESMICFDGQDSIERPEGNIQKWWKDFLPVLMEKNPARQL